MGSCSSATFAVVAESGLVAGSAEVSPGFVVAAAGLYAVAHTLGR